MSILIRNGTIICPQTGRTNNIDLLIENGVISKIAPNISQATAVVIDATNKYILPGFFDMHCHLREPGFEYKETLESGMRAGLAGGFTSLACMPNTKPAIDTAATARFIIERAKQLNLCKLYPVGAITKAQAGEQLNDFSELKNAGVIALSDDGKPLTSAALMRSAVIAAAQAGLLILSHCEDQTLSADGVMNEGATATNLGLLGIPALAEELITAREILIAESLNQPIHIMHVSTKGSVAIIRAAKARGVRVTAETCPHYFSLTDSTCAGHNTAAKVNPPLRTADDVAAIIEGLRDNTIDVIATDHAPHHADEKNCDFTNAAFGISGLETAFAVANTYLVRPSYLTLEELTKKMSFNPAQILGKSTETLTVGAPADITIVDANICQTVDSTKFYSQGKNTPFNGLQLQGAVEHTIANGTLKFSRDSKTSKLTATTGCARISQ
ncbi:MAG: dihydroorotase [Bacillota bacterium]